MIPWWEPQVTGDELEYLREVLTSNFVNDGPMTREFEVRVAQFLGVRNAVCTTSGTAAIFLALYSLGVGPGEEVIVPDLTFIATANAVRLCGAQVVLADVDPESMMVSADTIRLHITKHTKAIVPVHVSGRSCDIRGESFEGIPIVEDSCEALASVRPTGTLSCFSLSPNKIITTGQGGIVVTDDDGLAQRVRQLKDQGREVRDSEWSPHLGFNFKFTDLQAAYGMGQLGALADRLTWTKEINNIYRDLLSGCVEFPTIAPQDSPLWTDILTERRDGLAEHLRSKGFQTRNFWPPIHTQNEYRAEGFPGATYASQRGLWLPSSFTLEEDDVVRICHEVRTYLA